MHGKTIPEVLTVELMIEDDLGFIQKHWELLKGKDMHEAEFEVAQKQSMILF
jgi:hypothetical protein